MVLEDGDDLGRKGDSTDASVGLRWPDDVLAVGELLALRLVGHRAVLQVDVRTSEPEQLAAPQPAERRGEHEGAVSRLHEIGQLEDLVERRQLALRRVLGPRATDRAGVHREHTVLDRGIEDRVQQPVALRRRARPRPSVDEGRVPRADRRRPQAPERHPAERRKDVEPEQSLIGAPAPSRASLETRVGFGVHGTAVVGVPLAFIVIAASII